MRPACSAWAFPTRALIQVKVRDETQALAALEDALGCAGVAAAVGEIESVDLTAGPALQLACERHGALGFVIRRRPFGGPARTFAGRLGGGDPLDASPRRPASPRPASSAWARRAGGSAWSAAGAGAAGPGSWRRPMARILCVWSPTWAIANWRRRNPCASSDRPFALIAAETGVRRLYRRG